MLVNSVLKKTQLIQTIAISLILIVSIFSISLFVEKSIIDSTKSDFLQRVKDVKSTFEVLNQSIISSAKNASNVLEAKFDGLSINDDFTLVNGVKTNILTVNDEVINSNNALIDDFTNVTGAVATVFVRNNNDFYRVSSSLRKEDGSRAVGTFLTKEHPAFNSIMNKKDYIGVAKLFGKNYMTVYKPVIANDEIIAILFVGYDFDDLYSVLENNLSKIQLGTTGYIYTLNSKESTFIIHPNHELKGKKIDSIENKEYSKILNETIMQKEGVFTYKFIDKDGKSNEKITAFTTFDNWNIVIGTDVNLQELLSLNTIIRNSLVAGGLFLLFVILGISFFIILKVVNGPLVKINSGLANFFAYLNRENPNIELINNDSNDEFGEMAKVINENIKRIKLSIDDDEKLLNEVIEILGELEQGNLSKRLKFDSSNPSLFKLKKVLNDMAQNLEKNVDSVLLVLEEYSKNNYTTKVDNKGLSEHLLRLANNVNNLSDTINSILIENKSNGLTLEHSSKILLENVDNLNITSNQAAVSIEQTAAALEEITSNIRSNNDNITKMSQYSNEITNASKKGEILANQTTESMEEINHQVNLINDAITVIDQIAFQTNILSLNAAVEAATAGEVGKGFAVVAQEVRNLASRSAEAAKDIKKIVESATKKANEGKEISSLMIEGYSELNDSIEHTLELIKDVDTASKEQLLGIEQINDAINELDKQTQKNANIANLSHNIAIETDFISKLIVKNANDKEFIGKGTAQIKDIQKILNSKIN